MKVASKKDTKHIVCHVGQVLDRQVLRSSQGLQNINIVGQVGKSFSDFLIKFSKPIYGVYVMVEAALALQ
jgi:hypothetical protein